MKKNTGPKKGGQCACCSMGVEKFTKLREGLFRKYGWVVDAVPRNVHTHGLPEKYGHRDLQVVLPIEAQDAHKVISIVVKEIGDGKSFKAGDSLVLKDDVVLSFADAIEGGRKVLMVGLPTKERPADSRNRRL